MFCLLSTQNTKPAVEGAPYRASQLGTSLMSDSHGRRTPDVPGRDLIYGDKELPT